MTITVIGERHGSVASRPTAGKHVFHIDEPTGLAGDDIAAGPESEERYKELQRAVDANYPVLDLFANATPVKVALLVN